MTEIGIERNKIVHGDAWLALKELPAESVHLTFTSPPYFNARSYSHYSDYESYLNFLSQVFSEVYRLTKEGRFLCINTSPVIIPRESRAHSSKRLPIPFDLNYILTRNGWDFIDDIIWEKPEASVKNRIGGFLQHRKPLAWKPNCVTEYIMVYRKKTEKLIDWNIRQYGEEVVPEGFETTNVWRIRPISNKVHPAVFPSELAEKVIQYYSFKGDLVLDPFAGSGTTGKVAQKLDRRFLMVEAKKEYIDLMLELDADFTKVGDVSE